MATIDGDTLKQNALKLLEAERRELALEGRRALLNALLKRGIATADEVYAGVELPPGVDPRCLGAVPGPLVKRGIITSLGYTKSKRPGRHASPVQMWQLKDRTAALAWLATHSREQEAQV